MGELDQEQWVTNRKGLSGVEGGKCICYQWKKQTSVRKETVAVSVTRVKMVHKNPGHTAATPSEPTVFTRSCQRVGCARKRLQSHAVRRKLKLFLSMQVTHGWNSQLLTCGIWLFSVPFFTEPTNNTKDQVRGNSSRNTTWKQAHPNPNQGSNPARNFCSE